MNYQATPVKMFMIIPCYRMKMQGKNGQPAAKILAA
jgi:hypothetical protein